MRIFTNGEKTDPAANEILAECDAFINEGDKSIRFIVTTNIDCKVLFEYVDPSDVVKLTIPFYVGAHRPCKFDSELLQNFVEGETFRLRVAEEVVGKVHGVLFVSSL